MNPLCAPLEALLFAAGRPMSINQLAKQLGQKPQQVREALSALSEQLAQAGRGVALTQLEDKVQLVTNPAHGPLIEQFVKDEFTGPLSRAALETLAIIAYRGPISKPHIDTVRGVNSAIMLRTLLIRGLVERKRSAADARSYEYGLSFDFLRHLGLTQLADLPKYDELHNNAVMERFTKAGPDVSIEPNP
ncbi:MAG: SMC-Scp complex subunit ScpB [bacterium]|nr:SMC-Scp complex subunit ScpB [bacterium]